MMENLQLSGVYTNMPAAPLRVGPGPENFRQLPERSTAGDFGAARGENHSAYDQK